MSDDGLDEPGQPGLGRPGVGQPGAGQPGVGQPGVGTRTLVEREVVATPRTSHGDGDHERFSHYVRKEKILESALSGDAVVALCGKVWVPGRDPQRFPICPECKEIHDGLSRGAGGDSGDGAGGGSSS